jgi:hypothetical protein
MGVVAKHLLIYLAGALVLLGTALYVAFGIDGSALTWFSFIVLLLWLLLYFPGAFWWEYGKFVRLAREAKELAAADKSKPADLKPILMLLATDHLGLPEFLARRIVRRIDVKKLSARPPQRRGRLG